MMQRRKRQTEIVYFGLFISLKNISENIVNVLNRVQAGKSEACDYRNKN